MLMKIFAGLFSAALVFAGYVATRPADFKIEREITIQAPAEVIFPYLQDLHKFTAWDPWSKLDPNIKQTFAGPAEGVGATYSWQGNRDVGEGKMVIEESQ